MSLAIPATEIQKNFGLYHDKALTTPVKVTKYGRETVYIVSADTFHSMKQAQRKTLAASDLSDDMMSLIMNAEIPAEERYSVENQALPS